MRQSRASTPDPLLHPEDVRFAADLADEGSRLDAFLVRRMPWRSRTRVQELIRDGQVRLTRAGRSGEVRRPAAPMVRGDEVLVTLPRPKRDLDAEASGADRVELPVLFEDAWLLAVDKPPDVPVHPAGRNLYRTVITELHKRYRRPDDPAADVVPKLCHRLDLETSGVLLVAKEDEAHRRVSALFRERSTEKEYLAIVRGVPDPPAGLIDRPLGPAVASRVAMARAVRYDSLGQPARTGYAVVEAVAGFALLKVRLHTGRHHQIRVHLAAIGHPIVGDKIYGGDEELFLKYYDGALTAEDRRRLLLPRQALHAHRLAFTHPMTGERLDLTAPLPDDLSAFLADHR